MCQSGTGTPTLEAERLTSLIPAPGSAKVATAAEASAASKQLFPVEINLSGYLMNSSGRTACFFFVP